MIRRILLASAGALALAGTAFAADLAPPPPPPPPPPLWTGFYAGLNAGYTFGGSNSVRTSAVNVFDLVPAGLGTTSAVLANFTAPARTEGFIGGGQIGYNYQFANSFVAGIEADIQGIAGASRPANLLSAAVHPVFGTVFQTAVVSRSLDYLGTVRGRLGFLVTPRLLVYGTGGFAYGGASGSTNIFQIHPPAGVSDVFGTGAFSNTRVGWTAGGGGEWLLVPNLSIKVEYLYYDLGSVTYNVGPLVSTLVPPPGIAFASVAQSRTRNDGHIIRAGVNYHFNWGAPVPIVARY